MTIMEELKALEAKVKGEASGLLTRLQTFLQDDKAKLVTALDAETAKGTEELKALWAQLKAHL